MNELDFYERVKELVKQKNITVRNLIENCGMNYDSYNSCKRYNNLPRADEAVKIAQALNVSVEFLVTGIEPESKADIKTLISEINKVIEKYS